VQPVRRARSSPVQLVQPVRVMQPVQSTHQARPARPSVLQIRLEMLQPTAMLPA
jgi:hypothetical protein